MQSGTSAMYAEVAPRAIGCDLPGTDVEAPAAEQLLEASAAALLMLYFCNRRSSTLLLKNINVCVTGRAALTSPREAYPQALPSTACYSNMIPEPNASQIEWDSGEHLWHRLKTVSLTHCRPCASHFARGVGCHALGMDLERS